LGVIWIFLKKKVVRREVIGKPSPPPNIYNFLASDKKKIFRAKRGFSRKKNL